MLQSLPPEQQPIAQQLLRGGVPAVRTALHFERERARDEGRPEPSTEGVLAIAESLVSRVKAAEWRDRAEAALKAGDDLPMRDLRALVTGSDVARDEVSRPLAVSLREMLDRRVEAHRGEWAAEVTRHLDEGHVVRALRLSSRPPDPTARLSAELATRLRDAGGAGLGPSEAPDRWLALLAAVSESPVRRAVKPAGLPDKAAPELLEIARQQAGRVPGLAPLLGLAVPPPPGPARSPQAGRSPVSAAATKALARRPPRGPRPPRPAGPPAPAPAPSGGPGAPGVAALPELQPATAPSPEHIASVAEPPAGPAGESSDVGQGPAAEEAKGGEHMGPDEHSPVTAEPDADVSSHEHSPVTAEPDADVSSHEHSAVTAEQDADAGTAVDSDSAVGEAGQGTGGGDVVGPDHDDVAWSTADQ